jgi:hypothetical protein
MRRLDEVIGTQQQLVFAIRDLVRYDGHRRNLWKVGQLAHKRIDPANSGKILGLPRAAAADIFSYVFAPVDATGVDSLIHRHQNAYKNSRSASSCLVVSTASVVTEPVAFWMVSW